jgi:transcription elongation GreA/GreB family factor
MGQAILGHRAGDTVNYETPRGQSLDVEIVSIAPLG